MVRYFKFFLICIIFFVLNIAEAQTYQFDHAIRLDDQINSTGEELNPIYNPKDSVLYFSRLFFDGNVGGKFAGGDVWSSKMISKNYWKLADNRISIWNNESNNELIGINSDGTTYYLRNPTRPDKGILFSKRKNRNTYSIPELIRIKGLPKEGFTGFYMHPSYSVMLLSMKGKESLGEEDLYVSLKNEFGVWSEPRHLGSTINSEGFDISPFLSPDGLKLYFASNGHGGFGNADIFVSERKYGVWDVWSKPVNLGDKINSTSFDAYFSIYKDSTCFFVSNREGELSDIYTSKMLPGSKVDVNSLISALVSETEGLLAEIKASSEGYEYNYVSFADDSDELTETGKKVLDVWTKSFLNGTVSNEVVLTYDHSGDMSYGDELLFSKRLNNVYNYLLSNGARKDQLKIARKGQNLELSESVAYTTVVLLIE